MRIKFYAFCFASFLTSFVQESFSQNYTGPWGTLTERPNTPINEMINGYIEILPQGYDPNAAQPYPLIIFLEGQSQSGNGTPAELSNLYGPGMFPTLARDGASGFTNTQKFVILTPQPRTQITGSSRTFKFLSPDEVNDVINYALQHYYVDVNRIYLLGLSLGGGSAWAYAGQSVDYANRVAAIVPFSGASKLAENPNRDDNIVNANLPVWTFVGENDPNPEFPQNAQDYINAIIAHSPHPEALITIVPSGSHQSGWVDPLQYGKTYNNSYPNLLDWLLMKTRSLSELVFAQVNAGPDQILNLANGSMVLNAHSISFNNAVVTLNGNASNVAGGRPIVGTRWVKVDGTGGAITNPTSLNTTVTNLLPGSYTYQLRVTDDQGLVSVDNVKITVVAPPENKYKKIEAENHTAYSGLPGSHIDKTSMDEGPAYTVGWFASGSWVEYTFNLPTAGMYSLYYRYNSSSGNPVINITSDGITYSKALVSGGGWRSDSLQQIHLGSSATIRFLSQGTKWNFNYFELAQLTAESPLPVKFVYFNAQCTGNAVNVQWKTVQEENSSEFSVERSIDGVNWSEVGRVAAAGQSSQEKSYTFVDKTPASSGLYRITEHDLTGQTTMSSIIKTSCSSRNAVSLYPNPSSGNSSLSITLEQSQGIILQVLDSKGVLMQQRQLQLPSGTTIVPLEISSYSKGVYSVRVQYNNEVKTIKLIRK